jgi:hypothetical protein
MAHADGRKFPSQGDLHDTMAEQSVVKAAASSRSALRIEF